MDELRRAGDSAGSEIYVEAQGVPPGLGEPVYRRLDACLAYAFMGLNAVKGVEIGDGFEVVGSRGSLNADRMGTQYENGFASNHAGGILGGISTGAPITARVAIKPTPSIRQEMVDADRRTAKIRSSRLKADMTRVSVFVRHRS